MPGREYKIEFLICGSPNDAFYSQAAIFRYFLDSFGGIYRAARLVLCLDSNERDPLPKRWRPYFKKIEIHTAKPENPIFHHSGRSIDFDGRVLSYSLINSDADLSIICDADTLLVRPFPETLLDDLIHNPAIGAVIAHYPPGIHLTDERGKNYSHLSNEQFWEALSASVIGRPVTCENTYTLESISIRCPFYINNGFIAGKPYLMKRLYDELFIVQPKVREFFENWFYGQIAVAMAVESAGLPTRVLPMRYNFPNDPIADAKYPGELDNVIVIHYLRTNHFDRHQIFASADNFYKFLSLDLTGSNLIFQNYVNSVTNGVYPFRRTLISFLRSFFPARKGISGVCKSR